MSESIEWAALRAQADAVRTQAYAPYSGFEVGAALLATNGRVFTGANVENASYGLSLCAERSAIAQAIAAGSREFHALCIVAPGPDPATPCGMCRQVLAEFPPDFVVRCYTPDGAMIERTVAGLIPDAFGPANLSDTEPPK